MKIFEVRNRVKIYVFSHVTFWNLGEKKWNYENTTGIFWVFVVSRKSGNTENHRKTFSPDISYHEDSETL